MQQTEQVSVLCLKEYELREENCQFLVSAAHVSLIQYLLPTNSAQAGVLEWTWWGLRERERAFPKIITFVY